MQPRNSYAWRLRRQEQISEVAIAVTPGSPGNALQELDLADHHVTDYRSNLVHTLFTGMQSWVHRLVLEIVVPKINTVARESVRRARPPSVDILPSDI